MKISVLAITVLMTVSSLSAIAGEFGNRCTTALTKGEVVHSDCSVNSQFQGNTLCFGNEDAKKVFMQTQDKQQFVEKAAAFYPKVLTGQAK